MSSISRSLMGLRLWKTLLTGTVVFSIPFHDTFARHEQTLSLRAIQSRYFETTDQKKIIEAIVSTLQDMGYIIIRTDNKIGFVTATHFSDDIVEITVTTQPGPHSIIVRASARLNDLPLENDPAFYQLFFNRLSQALFLNANTIY